MEGITFKIRRMENGQMLKSIVVIIVLSRIKDLNFRTLIYTGDYNLDKRIGKWVISEE